MLVDTLPVRWTLSFEGAWKQLETWGVYCTDHQVWVATGPSGWNEREAYQAMCDLESTHPMRLEIRSYNQVGPTQDEDWTECPDCGGAGDCDCCGRECLRCDGAGEIERDDFAYARAG